MKIGRTGNSLKSDGLRSWPYLVFGEFGAEVVWFCGDVRGELEYEDELELTAALPLSAA